MLQRAITAIVINSLALFVIVEFLNEITGTGDIKLYIIGGIIIGVLNFSVKPLLKILSIPFVILTAGLFLIVINAVILYVTQWIINTMEFRDVRLYFVGIGSYLIAAILLGLINWAQGLLFKKH